MITSPSNIIEGLIQILLANVDEINALIKTYRKADTLHLFKGMRKTLPLSSFPSLEFEPSSGSMEWATTSAMVGEYTIECTLTVNCGTSIEMGAEYISEITRKIIQIFNYPVNMTWQIPNEFQDKEGKVPVYCQYSDIRSVEYASAKDFVIRVARWQITCRVVETFPLPGTLLGPAKVDWKKEPIPEEPKKGTKS